MLYKTIFQRFRSYVRSNPDYVYSAINSTAAYIGSYLLIYLINQLVTVLIASGYHIKTVMYYYGIRWAVSDFSRLWSKDSVITIFISGPATLFFLSLIFLFGIFDLLYYRSRSKIVFMWLFINSMSRILGGFIISNIIFLYSSNLVADFLYISLSEKVVIMIASIILIIILGYKLSGAFLLTSDDDDLILRPNRLKFLFFQALLPFFAGNIIMMLVNIPNLKFEEVFLYFFPLVFIIPVILNSPKPDFNQFEPAEHKILINRKLIVISLILLVAFRIVFNTGIHFGNN
ncbi:MAG: hypothetical protein NTW49_13730 [Bacteroidia bacterium]|nr:hypothetical protein [Bacteroidia bacterium]